MTDTNSINPAKALHFLRAFVKTIFTKALPSGEISASLVEDYGFGRARFGVGGIIGVSPAGLYSFGQLTLLLFEGNRRLYHGTNYKGFSYDLFGYLLDEFVNRVGSAIVEMDLNRVLAHVDDWLSTRVSDRTILIPCMLSPWPSPPIVVGPVVFKVIDEHVLSWIQYDRQELFADFATKSFLNYVKEEHANWLALVEVKECDKERAFELANLTVDLAIVVLQLIFPQFDTKNMSRLADRRGTPASVAACIEYGCIRASFSRVEPGQQVGTESLGQYVNKYYQILNAGGHVISSFLTGNFALRKLEQTWCDAAYWFHQGLAEPLNTIAVTKLETAIEGLVSSESSKGSERRILDLLNALYGLSDNDSVGANSDMTAKKFANSLVHDRSRILHGTWSTLVSTLDLSRDVLEGFTASMLRIYVSEFEKYKLSEGSTDDLKCFLNWVKTESPKSNPIGGV